METETDVIDLVLATVGRTSEARRLLRSLAAQTYRDFRLIVVDQNDDDRLVPLVDEFAASFSICHLRSARGISYARNVALPRVDADVIGFPDDDCWYPPDLLERVSGFLVEHPLLDGLHGRSFDESGRPTSGLGDERAVTLTRYNLWSRVASPLLFVRRRVVDVVGPFDEMLGLGSPGPWGGAEDLDYVLRCVSAGLSIYYDPSLCIYHLQRREHTPRPNPDEAYRYAMGMGRVLRKGRVPVWFAAYLCARGYLGALVEFGRGRPHHARFYLAAGRGRLRGWLRSPSTRS